MCYCSVNDVKCIWELVGGDIARAGRSHNLEGWGGKSSGISSEHLTS